MSDKVKRTVFIAIIALLLLALVLPLAVGY